MHEVLTLCLKQGLVKLSITSFNMRLTGLSSRNWMYAHWTFFGILVAYIICALFVPSFSCTPIAAEWDSIATGHLDKPPTCIRDPKYTTPLSTVHIVMDFCLLAVPCLVLWKVQMPWATKIRLYFLFSLGAVCCFAAVMREVAQARLIKTADYTCKPLIQTHVLPKLNDFQIILGT